jgi:hypothetical protein
MNSKLIAAFGFALVITTTPSAHGEDVPKNLVVDFRLFEARSISPDYKAMESLAFFIDTDGAGVSDRQWLATIARKVPDSFLATLKAETVRVEGGTAHIEVAKRSRSFETRIDLSEYLERGTFNATVTGELKRRNESERSFEKTIELRAGGTFVVSGDGFELSASEYLSHFRDYSDADHRREVYDELRDFSVFLILAVTLRVTDEPENETPVMLSLPPDVELPLLESPLDVRLIGTIELELDIDANGAPEDVKIVSSSIPEVNPRLLGEASKWRFPNAAGTTGRLILELTAEP